MGEAYDGGHELRILDVESPLRREKRVPVLSPPEVFAAYVPSHARGDLFIGDHWIFFKLRDGQWYFERLRDPDPPSDGELPGEELKPLREFDWDRMVVPRK